jgi:hypothetical protein
LISLDKYALYLASCETQRWVIYLSFEKQGNSSPKFATTYKKSKSSNAARPPYFTPQLFQILVWVNRLSKLGATVHIKAFIKTGTYSKN